MRLFEINQQIRDILEQVEDGELTDEQFSQLNDLNVAAEIKCDALACLIKENKATATMIEAEEKRLKERKTAHLNKAERLGAYLSDQMLFSGRNSYESARCKVSFRQSMAVQIDDEQALPQEYFRIKTESEPDKTMIKDALQEGREVPGARIVTRQNLQVR
jgi:hypothetical protein